MSRTARPRIRPVPAALVVAALGATVLLAGCSAGGEASSSGGAAEGMTAPDSAKVPAPAAVPADRTAAGAPAAAGGSTGSGSTSEDVATTPALVVTAWTSMSTTDVPGATARLDGVAAAYGATVSSQQVSTGQPVAQPASDAAKGAAAPDSVAASSGACPSGGCDIPPTGYAWSTTTLRVAPDKVDPLLAAVSRLGTHQQSGRSSQDVTTDVADVAARVANAEASVARVRALMVRANTIGDVVALEAELSRRQGDLEALQARQRALADQTGLATVTVTFTDTGAPVVVEEPGTGFLAGLREGWKAFTAAAVGALTVLGAVTPFLVALVLLALVAVLVYRLAVRGRAPVAPTGDQTAG